MSRGQAIRTRPGRKPGELIVSLPPGWELRLRRVLKHLLAEALPDPHERGLSEMQRQSRLKARRNRMREALCRHVTDLVTADIVGREIALGTRGYFGTRRGSLREQVQAVLREVLLDDRRFVAQRDRRI